MSYVSARGQVEPGPGESYERPNKRARTNNSRPGPAPDAHAKPPDSIKSFYKRYQKYDKYEIARRLDLVDCDSISKTFTKHLVRQCTDDLPSGVNEAFSNFLGKSLGAGVPDVPPAVYQVHDMPGKSRIQRRR